MMVLESWKRVSVVLLLCVTTAIASHGQAPSKITFKTILTFNGRDGEVPNSPLVQATDGNLYGTTAVGGIRPCGGFGCGTIFRITPQGTLTKLHDFCALENCGDGAYPNGPLVQATDGNFYGTTFEGGQPGICNGVGCGTVFKMTAKGKLTALHKFDGADGWRPSAGLIQATDGNLYGTTQAGGAHDVGTVFKISSDGTFTKIYDFCTQANCADGSTPLASLVQGADGNLYGTTQFGGAIDFGTVFKLSTLGNLTTLHSFQRFEGSVPQAPLIQATDGNFYGTTFQGPSSFGECPPNGCGTVFKITAQGKFTTLHFFNGFDGYNLASGLAQATNGILYGTAQDGGLHSSGGTVFQITMSGKFTLLRTFCLRSGCHDGQLPAGLTQATNGTLYGTTEVGGRTNLCDQFGCGTVYSLSVGLGPFIETKPTSGKVGAKVIILGTDLTGATSVSFHGTEANFKVVSKSEITTDVPTGATTGKVKVTTPHGTLVSNVAFRITK